MEKFLRDFLRRFEILREIFCVGLGIYGVKDVVFGGWLDMMHDALVDVAVAATLVSGFLRMLDNGLHRHSTSSGRQSYIRHSLLRFERLKNGAFKRLGVRRVQVIRYKIGAGKRAF